MDTVTIDWEEYQIPNGNEITAGGLLALTGKSPREWALVPLGETEPLNPNHAFQRQQLAEAAFVTDNIGFEEATHMPGAITINIDGEKYMSQAPQLTGEKIMRLAGKSYQQYSLKRKMMSGQRLRVEEDEEIFLGDEDLDRFETAPRDAQHGGGGRSRLTSEDYEYLNANYKGRWELTNQHELFFKSFPLPKGYYQSTIDMIIPLPPNYPDGPVEKFYLIPGIKRRDGKGISNVSGCNLYGGSQFWSRKLAWRPGRSGISNTIHLVENELEAEAR